MKMASPKLSTTVESAFDEAKSTGLLNLGNRKLKKFPKSSLNWKSSLSDTTECDLSDNRFTDVPVEACEFVILEKLNCYSNMLKCIPKAIVQLQALVHLNLSCNQLTFIPQFIGQLRRLEVLLASNNKLVSMPEEISELKNLKDLDISCNEITHLPEQIGEMKELKSLNIRNNLLVRLPQEFCKLKLRKLDVSDNKIEVIPHEYCQMIDTLQDLQIKNNPLISPPAKICTKGGVHVMKYLKKQAQKEDRKIDILNNEINAKTNSRNGLNSLQSYEEEFDLNYKRRTFDSGYSTISGSREFSTELSVSQEHNTKESRKPYQEEYMSQDPQYLHQFNERFHNKRRKNECDENGGRGAKYCSDNDTTAKDRSSASFTQAKISVPNQIPHQVYTAQRQRHDEKYSSNGTYQQYVDSRAQANQQQLSPEFIALEKQTENLRRIIESCLKVKLPGDLPTALRDGVVLCHLANHVRPRSISSIHVPSQTVPQLSTAKCRRNIENFLEACRRIGVKEEVLCTTSAVLEMNGLPYICETVKDLLSRASKLKLSTV